MLPGDWLRRFRGGAERERPLAPLTTWRIGGPAQIHLEPAGVEELVETLAMLRRIGLPWRLIGGGSNLLIPDRGVRGAVISLARLHGLNRRGHRIVAEAGVDLHELVRFAAAEGLSGAEPLAGIPGTVGGAIFGNAGGRLGDIGRLTRSLVLMDARGSAHELEIGEGFFAYRRSAVGDRIVLRAELELTPADRGEVLRRTAEIIHQRRRTQPGWVGNAGCVFKNPAGPRSAGHLIEGAGLKGTRLGGLVVSPIHANFFENDGTATSEDADALIDRVRDGVRQAHGVDLEVEVRRWSE